MGSVTVLIFGATPVWANPPNCTATYDAAEKASVVSVLRAKLGDAYKDFDLEHPILVNLVSGAEETIETIHGKIRIDPRRYSWLGFIHSKGHGRPSDMPDPRHRSRV